MNPLAHTGDSANISWYAERPQDSDYVYAEVLRNDVQRGPGRTLIQRPVPEYHIIVKRVTPSGNREVARFTYAPAKKPNPLILGNRTVTRLVRAELEKRS